MANQAVIELQRMDNTQPWGMRLKGGVDQGLPLHIEHVSSQTHCSNENSLLLVKVRFFSST
jgi:hypothetical protein